MTPSRNSDLGPIMPAAHAVQNVSDKSALPLHRWHSAMTIGMMASPRILFALVVPTREKVTSCRRSVSTALGLTHGPCFNPRMDVGAFGFSTKVTSMGGASRGSGMARVLRAAWHRCRLRPLCPWRCCARALCLVSPDRLSLNIVARRRALRHRSQQRHRRCHPNQPNIILTWAAFPGRRSAISSTLGAAFDSPMHSQSCWSRAGIHPSMWRLRLPYTSVGSPLW